MASVVTSAAIVMAAVPEMALAEVAPHEEASPPLVGQEQD
jgi:hypothetical protein